MQETPQINGTPWGGAISAVLAIVAGLRWLFGLKARIMLLEAAMRDVSTDLRDLTEALNKQLERGSDRMRKHEDEIAGIRVKMAELHRD